MLIKIKNTAVFFLGFAGLIFFLHSVIPHQHHYNIDPDTTQQATNDHSSGKPLECHAFNDLAVDILNFASSIIPFPDTSEIFITEDSNHFSILVKQAVKAVFLVRNEKIPSFVFLKSSPSRGSPSFV